MILARLEMDLTGPDEYPAEEGSSEEWKRLERTAQIIFWAELNNFLRDIREKLPDDFNVETR